MEDDIRTYAKSMLPSPGMPVTRDSYIADVRKYAAEKHGQGEDVRMMAERTARYFWDRGRRG